MRLRIKEARERVGLTQKELANILGVKSTTFNGYETGSHDPKSDLLKQIATQCNTTVDYLLSLTDDPLPKHKIDVTFEEYAHIEKYRELDTHGKNIVDFVIAEELKRNVSATHKEPLQFPKETAEPEQEEVKASVIYYDIPVSAGTGQFLDNSGYIMLDVMETPPTGSEFVVRVCGDSMEPTYKDGDKLYISPTETVEEGEIGIFSINGDVYVKECGAGQLVSHNTKYKPIQISECDNVQCFGKVVGMCKKYR